MKKLLFLIISSAFILIIPNVVNAATTGIDFSTRDVSWGNSSSISVNLISGRINYYDSTAYFSFGVENNYALPYTAYLVMNDGNEYSCSLSSVATDTYNTTNNITVSALCHFYYTTDRYPVRIVFERTLLNGGQLKLPQRMMVVQGIHFDTSSITNSQQATTNAINGVNDSINNDNVSTNTENSSTASSWASQSASDSVVSDMVLMPITLLNAFSSGFSGSCQAYNLGSLYGTNLTLPCINISNYLGATLWGIIDVLMSGFLIYGIGKKFVRVFNDFTNLKDSQVDELYGGGNE